jgi:hypothetical protein
MKKTLVVVLLTAICLYTGAHVLAQAGPSQKEVMTNASVIDLVKLGLGEAVIIQKIRQSEPKFDTSNAGLAQLKAANVNDNIIMEMMNPGSSNASATVGATSPTTNTVVRQPSMNDPFGIASPTIVAAGSSGVVLIDGDKRLQMKYSTPDMRTNSMLGAMVNPLHKSRVRAALKENHSTLRIGNNSPVFEISIEKDANPLDVIAVVKLEPKSETREIEQGRGSITGVSTGFRKADLIAISVEEGAANQTQKSYRIRLVNPLVPGEYAVVVRGGVYYDFGVDSAK